MNLEPRVFRLFLSVASCPENIIIIKYLKKFCYPRAFPNDQLLTKKFLKTLGSKLKGCVQQARK